MCSTPNRSLARMIRQFKYEETGSVSINVTETCIGVYAFLPSLMIRFRFSAETVSPIQSHAALQSAALLGRTTRPIN
jgi:hypothetical protein